MKKIKNILFIMADQLRWDYLSCYGHPHLKTPHIDNLAKKGIYLGKQYKPVHKHSFYKKIINEKYPNSERYYSQGFQLPLNPNLKNKEINLICNKIIDAIKRFKLK